jgi:threonine aldolase
MSSPVLADLRSDTVTRPTPAMREAMREAEVGDDVFGDDPTVNRLEARAAEIFGKEASLFVPSGTMANQCCVGALTHPGDEMIAEASAHVLINEGGAASRFWGVQVTALRGQRGLPDVADVVAAIRLPDVHHPRTTLLSLENTHNYAGGSVLPLAGIDALTALARDRGLRTHLDGARVFNASVASGVPVARIARDFTLTSCCLSKGLGAPLGSLVIGSRPLIDECRRLRKALGGGMRQAGIIAAAGLMALEEGPALLAADHARARALAEELTRLPGCELEFGAPETNLVFITTRRDAGAVEQELATRGVLCGPLGPRRLRFAFHRDAGDDALAAARRACRDVLA